MLRAWARGHKHDWGFFASESCDTLHGTIVGASDPIAGLRLGQVRSQTHARGNRGVVFVQSAPDPNPIASIHAVRSAFHLYSDIL